MDAARIKPTNTCEVAQTREGEGHTGTLAAEDGLPSGGGPSLAGQPAFP